MASRAAPRTHVPASNDNGAEVEHLFPVNFEKFSFQAATSPAVGFLSHGVSIQPPIRIKLQVFPGQESNKTLKK